MDEAAYYHYLITAVREGSGDLSNATKLWHACEEFFPDSLNWEMDAAIDAVRRQGRSLAQIDELIEIIRRETEHYAAESWVQRPISYLRTNHRIERASQIGHQPSTEVFKAWCAAGNALLEVRSELWKSAYWRTETQSPLELAMCELCWRTAAASARRSGGRTRFYCESHRPRSNNASYKRALKARHWRHPDPEISSGLRPFVFERLGHHRREIPTSIRANDPSLWLLCRLYAGEDIKVSDFSAHTIDLDTCWPKLSFTVEYLSAHRIELTDPRQIIETLDPLLTAHATRHETARRARLKDMRLLVLQKETPQLCWGGSSSLTIPGVA